MKWMYFHLYVIHGHFQPLRRGVDGGRARECRAREASHQRDVFEAGNRFRAADASRRPRHVDEIQAASDAPIGPRGDEDPQSPPRFQRQSLLGESVQNAQVPSRVPQAFGSIQHARDVCRDLFGWYNTEHYHSGIGLLTPESVHYGRAATIVEGRKQVLLDFFGAHPERFVKGTPKPPEIPSAAWINPPTTKTTHQMGAQATSETSDDLQVPLICTIYGDPVLCQNSALLK